MGVHSPRFPPYIFVYSKRIDVIMASNKSYICLLHYLVQIFLIETDLGESLWCFSPESKAYGGASRSSRASKTTHKVSYAFL